MNFLEIFNPKTYMEILPSILIMFDVAIVIQKQKERQRDVNFYYL